MDSIDRIKARYFRKTMANPDGAIGHHGDCHFWDIKICTCGLLHDLLQADQEEVAKIYPKFGEEFYSW